MTTPLLQYVARFDGGGRYFWVWRGRLQGELVMVLPVCRISVSICCDKRRETSFKVPAESGRSGERRVVAVCTRISSQEYVYDK